MKIKFESMDQAMATHLRDGGEDAYGNLPERHISEGAGVPCRCCMQIVGKGEPYLIAAWKPFTASHAYAETGPVFLHADPCAPLPLEPDQLPAFLVSSDYILRGYDADERTIYGTGGVVPLSAMRARFEELLADPAVKAVHIRS